MFDYLLYLGLREMLIFSGIMSITMYVCRSSITPTVIRAIEKANILVNTIESELEEIDVSANFDLRAHVQKESHNNHFPLFYSQGIPIGNVKQLEQYVHGQRLRVQDEMSDIENSFEILDNVPNENTPQLSTGYVSGSLNTMEWLVRGSASLLSPTSWFSWASSSSEIVKPYHITEYPVIQTNWYWRKQKRILRFIETSMERINPETQEVRHSRPYKSFSSLVVISPKIHSQSGDSVFLHFSFLEDLLETSYEYYQISPLLLPAFVETIQNFVSKLPIKYETE